MKRIPAILLLIGVVTVISGYLRELALAATWGAGSLTDAFFVALAMPMVIMDLVIGSALTAVVVPVFARVLALPKRAPSESAQLFCTLLIAVAAASLAMVAALLICAKPLIQFLGPGLDATSQRTAARYLYWLVWLIPLNGFVVLACQTLNAMRVFVIPACSGLIVNLVFVVGVLGAGPLIGAPSLVVAALAGPAIVAVILLRVLAGSGMVAGYSPRFCSPWFRQALALGAPMSATVGIGSGLGLVMISHLVLRKFGSELGEGVISALSYAFRIYQVPMTLVIATVGVLVAPTLAQFQREGREGAVHETCRELLNWGLLVLIPAAVVLHTQADAIVQILFQYGRYDAQNARMTAEVLRGFALAIPFEAVLVTFLRVIQTLHRPAVSVAVGVLTIAVLIAALEWNQGTPELVRLPYAFAGALGLGSAACLYSVSVILHTGIFPSFKELAVALVLGVGLAAVLTVWEQHNVASSLVWSLSGMLAWTASYFLLAALALPERRRAVAALVRAVRSTN